MAARVVLVVRERAARRVVVLEAVAEAAAEEAAKEAAAKEAAEAKEE